MQYKVLKIEEDIDFGCEMSLRHDDGLLYERDINEGDLVTLDENRELWKA